VAPVDSTRYPCTVVPDTPEKLWQLYVSVAVPPVPTETFVPLIVAGPVADLGEHGVLPT